MVSLNAHFDGKVIVPDEPLNLRPNQKVRISVEAIDSPLPAGKRSFGQQKGVLLHLASDFDDYLGDEFWGLSGEKPE